MVVAAAVGYDVSLVAKGDNAEPFPGLVVIKEEFL